MLWTSRIQKSGTNGTFLMRCRVFWSLEQRKEGCAWTSDCKCWKKVPAHQLGCFVLITCSDLSPPFSVEPAMRKGIKHSHVVYVDSPREAHTALQKAWGLVIWVSWCWMVGWPGNKSLLVFRNIWGYMFFLWLKLHQDKISNQVFTWLY